MSVDHRSPSRSFLSRYLHAPRTTALAVLALGLGLAAPSAHGDEGIAPAPPASVTQPSVAAPSANIARPLEMRDLSASSSIGLRAEGGYLTREYVFADTVHAYIGDLKLDGELALGDNFKLFASFPVTGAEANTGPDRESRSAGGHGNLTLGAQVQGGQDGFQAAFGGSYSNFGDEDGTAALYLHEDLASFAYGVAIVRGFGSVRGGNDDHFVQGEVSFLRGMREDDRDSDGGIGQLTLGGGARIDASRMFLAEVAVLRYIGDNDEGSENLYLADVGMRGAMGEGSRSSWGAKLSLLHTDGITTFGVGFDWRTDLPGLAGQ